MPLYPYKCVTCGAREDELFKASARPATIPCGCGGVRKATLSIMAKTPGTWGGGDTGHFNRGLGVWCDSFKDMERKAKERGLVPLSEVSTDEHFIDDHVEAEKADALQTHKDATEFQGRVAAGESTADAMAKTWTVSKLKERGMLDSSINGE